MFKHISFNAYSILGGKSLWQLDIKKQAMKDNSPEANKKKKKKAQPDDGSLFKDVPIREHLKGDFLFIRLFYFI